MKDDENGGKYCGADGRRQDQLNTPSQDNGQRHGKHGVVGIEAEGIANLGGTLAFLALDADHGKQNQKHRGTGDHTQWDRPAAEAAVPEPDADADKYQRIAQRIGDQIIDVAEPGGLSGQARENPVGPVQNKRQHEQPARHIQPGRFADGIEARRGQAGQQPEGGQVIGRDRCADERPDAGLDNAVNPRIVADNPIPSNH